MTEAYHPATNNDVIKRISKARINCVKMDMGDRMEGFAAPEDLPIDQQLRTALQALSTAMSIQDWDIVAEAYCLLQDAEIETRTTQAS